MTSLVNPSNINGNFPIAGQDNDSQGFRDNFTNIRNNFTFIKSEVEDLQAKAVLKSALTGTTLNNDFQGSKVKNLQVSNLTETVKDLGQFSSTDLQIDLAEGNVVKLSAGTGADIKINSVIKNWPASLQYARILLYVTIPDTTTTITLPATFTTDLSSIPGLRRVGTDSVINFTDPGDYIFELSSVNSGTTVFVRELTTGNPIFRDPNFYTLGLGIGKSSDVPQRDGYQSPTLILGFGDYLATSASQTTNGIAYQIDTLKGGNDTLLLKGSVTSYQSQVDDLGNVSAGVDSLQSAGFSVVKDRSYIDAGSLALSNINAGDLVGYYNAIGLTYSDAASQVLDYQTLGAIDFTANGTSDSAYGVGGAIVIKTKGDGTVDAAMPNQVVGAYNYLQTQGEMRTAVVIDNKQNVTIYGNLDVKGATTVIESTSYAVSDINITLGSGGTESTNQGAGIVVASNASDGGANLSIKNSSFNLNRGLVIANSTASSSTTTGALIVSGGVGVAGDMYVGGNLTVQTVSYENREVVTTTETVQGNLVAASSTPSTSTTTGALVVTGGAGIGNGLYVNGTTYLQNVSSGNILLTGGDATGLTNFSATYGDFARMVSDDFSSGNVNITAGYLTGITGAAFATHVATNLSTGNAVISGGYISALTNAYITTGVTTNFSTANALLTGGSITGVTGAATTLVATNFSSGNIRVTSGSVTGITGAATTLQATNLSSANAQLTGGSITGGTGAFTTLVATNLSSGNALVSGTGSAVGVTAAGAVSAVANVYAGLGYITNGLTAGNIVLGAGSTTRAPIQITQSGSALLTTATAGAVEYDGTANVFYATPTTSTSSSRAVINTSHTFVLSANTNINSTGSIALINTAYGGLGGTAIGAAQVAANTAYEVDIKLMIGMSATPTASTVQFTFGGTATFTSYNYDVSFLPTAGTIQTDSRTNWFGTTTMPLPAAGVIAASQSAPNFKVRIKGIIRTNAQGTLIPQLAWGTLPVATAVAIYGSYVKLTPLGSATGNVAIGNWTLT